MTDFAFNDRAFTDLVMARVIQEPVPSPARSLRNAVRTLDAAMATGAVWSAWHLATVRGTRVRRRVRIQSAVLLAIVAMLLAIGTSLAAAGAAVVVHTAITQHARSSQAAPATAPDPGQANNHGLVPVSDETAAPDGQHNGLPPAPPVSAHDPKPPAADDPDAEFARMDRLGQSSRHKRRRRH